MKILLAPFAFILFLAGCGGDDQPTKPPPVVAPNSAPVITSAANVNVVENLFVAYRISATDADNDTLSYAIEGTDSALFGVASDGVVRFLAAPSFETPRDADGDNVYLVTIAVSDGRVRTTQAIRITITNDREGIAVRRIATGFDNPVAIADVRSTNDLLIAERGGAIWRLNPSNGTRTLVQTVGDLASGPQRGVLGIAPSDNFVTDGILFVSLVRSNNTLEVRRFETKRLIPNNSSAELTINYGTATSQYGGALNYGIDGNLYLSTGDGGVPDLAQDPASRRGKLIQIKRNPDPFAGASPVYYFITPVATGLHDPATGFSFGPGLFIADRGTTRREELNYWAIGDAGVNFGWPFKEGTDTVNTGAPSGLTDPRVQYAHGGARGGTGIVAGLIYSGPIASLNATLVLGDIGGTIWTVAASALDGGTVVQPPLLERRNEDFTPNVGTLDRIAGFVRNSIGHYILDGDGEVFVIEPSA